MQALKVVLISALVIIGLSALVKAGGYGPHMPRYPPPQPPIAYQRISYATVPAGVFGVRTGGFGGGGLFFLIIIIVFVFILLSDDGLFGEED